MGFLDVHSRFVWVEYLLQLRMFIFYIYICALGWPVQGIWAAGMDGSDINAVARSHSGHLLATSDDLGKVNLFRYILSPYLAHLINSYFINV